MPIKPPKARRQFLSSPWKKNISFQCLGLELFDAALKENPPRRRQQLNKKITPDRQLSGGAVRSPIAIPVRE
jgi:hypothetical protein